MKLSEITGDAPQGEAPPQRMKLSEVGGAAPSPSQGSAADTPRWDFFGDMGRAASDAYGALKHDVGEAFAGPAAKKAEFEADKAKYGTVGGYAMSPVRSVQRMGNALRAPFDALGIAASPLTGALNASLGSALSYAMPGPTPKKSADEALGTAMMGLRPAGGRPVTPPRTDPTDALRRRAAETVERRFRQDQEGGGPTAQEASQRLTGAAQRGQPLALADIGGENVKGLAGNVARQPGPARNLIRQRFEDVGGESGTRLDSAVQQNVASGSLHRTTQNLMRDRDTAAAPAYQEMERLEGIWSPRVQELIESPDLRAGLARGFRLEARDALAEGRPFDPTQMGVDLDAEGNVTLRRVPNMRVLDMGKRGLDAMIADTRDSITGRLSTDGRSLNGLRRAYVRELDSLDTTGAYRRAREAWSGPSASLDALRAGRGALRAHTPEEITEAFRDLSPTDREFYRLGVADAMREEIGKKGVTAASVRDLARGSRNNWIKTQIRPLFDNETAYNRFIDSVTDERAIFDAERHILGGSQTASRLAEDTGGMPRLEAALNTAHGVGNTLSGRPIAAARNFLAAKRDLGLRPNPQLNTEIARILTDPRSLRDPHAEYGQGSRLLPTYPGPQQGNWIQRAGSWMNTSIPDAINPPLVPP